MFLFTVSIIPAYAQNIHFDEDEEKIRAEILECRDKIDANDSLTEATKTVQKRDCSSEIRNKYAETAMTFKTQNEIKIQIQNFQKCNDWHSEYQFLDEDTFKIQKNAQMVQSCISLYNDPLWTYDGDDRDQVLSDKLIEILEEIPIKTNISTDFSNDSQYKVDRIYSLEKKIIELEDELHNKNLIIREQMNVISNLANTLRNAIFDGFQSVYQFI